MFKETNFSQEELEQVSIVVHNHLINGNRFLVKCIIMSLHIKTYMLLEKIYNKNYNNFILDKLAYGEVESDIRIDHSIFYEAFEILKDIKKGEKYEDLEV